MGRPRKHPEPPRDPNWEPSEALRAKVHYLAWRWSLDRPDYLKDLYQEGLLAIWLKGETEAPLNHQLRTAKNRMLSVRKLGQSVDGKLDRSYRRPRPWGMVSLDHTGHVAASRSRVEEYVVERLAIEEVLALLKPHEVETLGLVYQGFEYPEIAARLGQYPHVPYRTMQEIRRKVRRYLRWSEEEISGKE
jgi:DNA-directed RNA polymerase specialized sigma24 family protein